jgi:hypothetical protein
MSTVAGSVILQLNFPGGQVLQLGSVSGDTAVSRIRTKPLDFIGPAPNGGWARDSIRRKAVQGIRFEMEPPSNGLTEVEFFTQNHLNEVPVSHGTLTVSVDKVVRIQLPNRRYFSFELKDTGASERWAITAIEVFGFPAGGRAD